MKTRVWAVVSQKGGAGKSLVAANLLVSGKLDGWKVAGFDLDRQGTLDGWADDRPTDDVPVDALTGDKLNQLPALLERLEAKGFDLAVLDCPGADSPVTNAAIRAADLCIMPIVPLRPDVKASVATIEAVELLGKPLVFVLNKCPPGERGTRSAEVAGALKKRGIVAPVTLSQRMDFNDAFAGGQGVAEYAPRGKSAAELRELWQWLKKEGRKHGKK